MRIRITAEEEVCIKEGTFNKVYASAEFDDSEILYSKINITKIIIGNLRKELDLKIEELFRREFSVEKNI